VAAAGEGFTKHFYARMFAAHPELKNVFNLQNQKTGRQQKALFSAVAASAVSVLETGELPRDMLEGIHQKHCALNVQPGQYSVVGEHILGTIREVLTPAPEVLDAWGALYGAIAAHAIEREEVIYKEAEAKTGGWRGERDFVVARRKMQQVALPC
jgi:nitric oxide dioxygenase